MLLHALEAGKKHGIGLGSAAATSFEGRGKDGLICWVRKEIGVLALYAVVGEEGGIGWGLCM